MQRFNPQAQREMVKDVRSSITGAYPTLAQLGSGYGNNAAIAWLVPQLFDLSEYCGCREKMNARMLEECAHIISTEFYYLKVSEVMLFFQRFKASHYGRFYGSVEPMVITESLRQFVRERNVAIARYEQEEEEARREEARKNAISREKWEQMKKQAV